MSHELIVRAEGEAELAEAFDWYKQRLTGLGSEFLLAVEAAFRSLHRNPYQYPVSYREVHRVLLRRFPYQVFFRCPADHCACGISCQARPKALARKIMK